MHLYALVILACTANGTCTPQTVRPGLTQAACQAQLEHADPKLACQAERRVAVAKGRQFAAGQGASARPLAE